MEIINVTTKKECQALRKGSAFTLEGFSLEEENINKLVEWIERYTAFVNKEIHVIKGKDMNKWYKLTGDNAYPDDLSIICIDLNNFANANSIMVPRFQIGARWLDDVIDNNLRREREKRA